MKKTVLVNAFSALFIIALMASCVNNEVKTLSINKLNASLFLGETDSLITTMTVTGDIKKLPQTWTSSNPTVASVENGMIQGLKAGTSIISVKAGDKSATCQVTVEDKLLPQFTNGNIEFYGDDYKTSLSNNSVLSLYSTTDTLLLEINTPLNITDSIPTGTYEMITNLNLADFSQFKPNTLLPAFQYQGYLYGSWFFNRRIFTPIMQGNIVNVLKNNVYSIQYNLFDYFGNSVSGSYSGTLTFIKRNNAPSTKNISRLKNARLINWKPVKK